MLYLCKVHIHMSVYRMFYIRKKRNDQGKTVGVGRCSHVHTLLHILFYIYVLIYNIYTTRVYGHI